MGNCNIIKRFLRTRREPASRGLLCSSEGDKTKMIVHNRRILTSVSTVALVAALLAAPLCFSRPAFADNECGAEGAGADTVNCASGAYGANINYINSDGLALNLNDAGITAGPAATPGVRIMSTAGNTNDIVINATNFGTITATGGQPGLNVVNSGTAGNGGITIGGGTITAGGRGALLQMGNTANAGTGSVTMTGGTITSGQEGLGILTSGVGNAEITISGLSSITSSNGKGLLLRVVNAASTGAASITINGGTISSDEEGVHILNAGEGASTITMTNGDIETFDSNGNGLMNEVSNGASTGTASITMSGGTITTNDINSGGLYNHIDGMGDSFITMTGGTIQTLNSDGHGAYNEILNNASTAQASTSMSGGTITTAGSFASGLLSAHRGLGDSTATMTNGSIQTAGSSSYGIWGNVINTGSAATATARMEGGSISTAGPTAHGIYSLNGGTGNALSVLTGTGQIETESASADGMRSQIINAFSTGTATARMESGTITTNLTGSYGVSSITAGLGDTTAVLMTGDINIIGDGGGGLLSRISNAGSTATATALMQDGTIDLTDAFASGVTAEHSGQGTALVRMEGGTITAAADSTYGLNARTTGAGVAAVQMMGGTVTSSGMHADGLMAQSTNANGTFDVDVTGGTVTGGGGNGASIHTRAAGGGTVDISAGVTINAGASGTAIRDGDLFGDGVDETGGDAVINSAGDINGDVVLGRGADRLTVTGATITGNVYGGDEAGTAGDGDDVFTLDGSAWNAASFFGGGGSDTVSLANATTGNMGASATIDAEDVEIDATSELLGTGGGTGVFDLSNAHVLNAGLVSLLDSAAGDYLLAGSWEAGSGFVDLDVDFSGAGPSDRLLIVTDMTGTTTLRVNNAGGPAVETGSTNTDGYSIVQVGGISTANAFELENGYVAIGPYEYRLYAFDPASSAAPELDPALAGQGVTSFWDYRLQTPGSSGPVLLEQISAYQAFTMGSAAFGQALLESLHKRAGEIRHANLNDIAPAAGRDSSGDSTSRFGFGDAPGTAYVRARGVLSDVEGDKAAGFEQDMWFVQAGYDWVVENVGRGRLRFGPAASFGGSKLKMDNGAEVDFTSPSLAMTATYEADNGAYIDGIAQGTMHRADISTPQRGDVGNADGWSAAISAEAGIPFAAAKGFIIEPQVQLTYQWTKFKGFTDIDDVEVEIGREGSLKGRLGFMLEKTFTTSSGLEWAPHVTFDIIHEFLKSDGITAGGIDFENDLGGTSAEIGLGFHGTIADYIELFFNISYGHALTDDAADSLAGTVRVKYRW